MTDWAKKANWLWAAGIFTVVYLTGGLWIVGPVRAWTFITTGELNEIGDFLAGVFSPLAFIWLVAAVLTQRQELDETRDQFGENQKVVDAQMKTISGQNELLVLQHQQAEKSASQTYRLNLFDKRFELFKRLSKVHKDMIKFGISTATSRTLDDIALGSAFVFSTDIEQYISDLAKSVDDYLSRRSKIGAMDEFGNPVLSLTEKENAAVDALRDEKQALIDALSNETLLELMWSSMRVSDN